MDGGLHPELHFSNNKLKQHTGNRKHVNDVTQHLPVFTNVILANYLFRVQSLAKSQTLQKYSKLLHVSLANALAIRRERTKKKTKQTRRQKKVVPENVKMASRYLSLSMLRKDSSPPAKRRSSQY